MRGGWAGGLNGAGKVGRSSTRDGSHAGNKAHLATLDEYRFPFGIRLNAVNFRLVALT